MTDDQLVAILRMMEALRLEIRAATLVQMRSESAAKAFPSFFERADEYAKAACVDLK